MARYEFDDDNEFGEFDEQGSDRYLFITLGVMGSVLALLLLIFWVIGPWLGKRSDERHSAPATTTVTTTPPATFPVTPEIVETVETTVPATTTTEPSASTTTTTTAPINVPTLCVPGAPVPPRGCLLMPPTTSLPVPGVPVPGVATTMPAPVTVPTTAPPPSVRDRPLAARVTACNRTSTGVDVSSLVTNPNGRIMRAEVTVEAVSGDMVVASRTWIVPALPNTDTPADSALEVSGYRVTGCRATVK